MDSTTKIIELASQNNGIVTAAMISSAGISRGSLKYLADTGRLDQVSRGVYTLPEVWEDEFVSIQERYKRGVFALDTALFLHDLTDRTPHKFHMAFPYGYNTSSPKAAGILCSCKKEPYYSLGIALVDTPAGNTVRAYNAEKTLCEILKPISHTDIQIITDALLKAAKSKGYKTTSTKKSVLKYVTDDVNLDDGQGALSVTIPHSSLQTVKYVYDEQNQVYKRYARNKAQTDWDTGNSITTKNIIITMCDNYTLEDSENKGRQGLKNIGTFNGYYITNGKAIKIKCIKESRNAQTKYQDLQGNEIKVNDGNTWINICPTNAKIVIEGPATETGVDTTNNV